MLNIDSVFEPGQAYVMFSRVQCIDQVFVLKNLNPANMRASRQAKEELLIVLIFGIQGYVDYPRE